MNNPTATKKNIAKHRGQYYVTLGMLEDACACFPVRKAIAKRLKTPYPKDSEWDDQHPNRDVPIRFTEELLRKVMGKTSRASVARPWQVLDYVANRADELYGSTVYLESYDWDDIYFEPKHHKEAVNTVIDKFREWGYIE